MATFDRLTLIFQQIGQFARVGIGSGGEFGVFENGTPILIADPEQVLFAVALLGLADDLRARREQGRYHGDQDQQRQIGDAALGGASYHVL